MKKSAFRITQFEFKMRKHRKALKKTGALKVRAYNSPKDLERQKQRTIFENEICKSLAKMKGGRIWSPTVPPESYYESLKAKDPEDWACLWYNLICPYLEYPCFWPYLLSPTKFDASNGYSSPELSGYGKNQILCMTWLRGLCEETKNSSASHLDFVTKLAVLYHSRTKSIENVHKEVWKLIKIVGLNIDRLIAFLNLHIDSTNISVTRLAQFHTCFQKCVTGEIDNLSFNFLNQSIRDLAITQIDFEDEYESNAAKLTSSDMIQIKNKWEDNSYPGDKGNCIAVGLVDVEYRLFRDQGPIIDFHKTSDAGISQHEEFLPRIDRHLQLQKYLLQSLVESPSNSNLICPFHHQNQTKQLCCSLIEEANALKETLGKKASGLKIIRHKRKNSNRKIYFIGPVPQFLTR